MDILILLEVENFLLLLFFVLLFDFGLLLICIEFDVVGELGGLYSLLKFYQLGFEVLMSSPKEVGGKDISICKGPFKYSETVSGSVDAKVLF